MHLSKKILSVLSLGVAGVALASAGAHAAGFYVQEISSSSAGAANAGAAAMPRDASVIFHNPSAITHLDGAQINGAVHALYTHTELVDDGSTLPTALGGGAVTTAGFTGDGGNPGGLQPIPNLYAAAPLDFLDGNLWGGIGVTTPFGLGPEYDDNFFGSFSIREAELRVIDVTPSLAYKINDTLSVGLSAIVQHADLNYEFNFAPTVIGDVEADDIAFGYKASMTYTPNDDWTVGLQYRSRTNLDLEGDIDAGAFGASDADGTLNLPDIATLGIAYDVNEQLTVMGGLEWFGWSNTDVATINNTVGGLVPAGLEVNFDYENTINISLGAEYQHDDTWTFRAGYQYDETPTQISERSPLNPDGNRHWFAGGATQKLDENWSFDYALTYIDIADGNLNKTLQSGATVVGKAEDSYAVIGTFGVNYKF